MIEAGTGVVIITPALGTHLAGMFEVRPAATVDRDITVRALVIGNGSERVALIVCDLICVTADIVRSARSLIEAATGIPPSHVMISATHTHSGPAPVQLLSTMPDPDYVRGLPQRIADAVSIAVESLQPACISSGGADTQDVCFNRRFRMKDGTVRFNPGIGNPDIVEVSGPTDPEVTAMLVEDFDGRAIALWACLSLHYVGVANQHAVSPDYYGDFVDSTAAWLGDDCVGFLTNGTSGQINNVDVRPHEQIPAAEQRKRVANAVAAAAVKATTLQPRHDEVEIEAILHPINIMRRDITELDLELAQWIVNGEVDDQQFGYVVGQSIPQSQLRQYAKEALAIANWPSSIESEVQTIRIGDFSIVGLPGEIFVEFGLALKEASPHSTTAVVSLANDYVGYIPTTQAFTEGAYETWSAKSAWAAPGTGENMIAFVKRSWTGT